MADKPLIYATDFNAIQTKIAQILGTGVGSRGYGQNYESSPVSQGEDIISDQWNKMRADLLTIKLHQDGNLPILVSAAIGNPVAKDAGDPVIDYLATAIQADDNRFLLGTGQFTVSPAASKSYTSPWSTTLTSDLTIQFTNSNEARYFFNSGGKIRITTSRVGGSSSAQNTSWSNLLNSAGTLQFGGNIPNPNYFYALTDTNKVIYEYTASTPYSNNVYRIQARCNVPDNSTGLANEITIRVTLTDGYVDPGNNPGDIPNTTGSVDGTLTITVDKVTATLNDPVIAGPSSVSLSNITVS